MANETPGPGHIGWVDLTVPEAGAIRDFYADVTGWTPAPVSMGDYQDFCMNTAGGQSVAGICHALGVNAGVPPVWMIYIVVADLDEAMRRCESRGGRFLSAVRSAGDGSRFRVIQDPSGAVAALYQGRAPVV